MRRFINIYSILGSLTGLVAAGLIFTAVSKAQGPERDKGVCRVEVGRAFLSGGYQCPLDRVMVGRWNDNLYCANLNVICSE